MKAGRRGRDEWMNADAQTYVFESFLGWQGREKWSWRMQREEKCCLPASFFCLSGCLFCCRMTFVFINCPLSFFVIRTPFTANYSTPKTIFTPNETGCDHLCLPASFNRNNCYLKGKRHDVHLLPSLGRHKHDKTCQLSLIRLDTEVYFQETSSRFSYLSLLFLSQEVVSFWTMKG